MIHWWLWWNCGVAPPVPSPLHLAQLTSIRPWDLSRQSGSVLQRHRRQRDSNWGRDRREINTENVKSICRRSAAGQNAAAVTFLIWLARPDADLTAPADVLWRGEIRATHTPSFLSCCNTSKSQRRFRSVTNMCLIDAVQWQSIPTSPPN